jgi:hypothetical protein
MNVPSLTILLAALGFATSASAASISFGTSTPPAGHPAATGSNWTVNSKRGHGNYSHQPASSTLLAAEQENVKLDQKRTYPLASEEHTG